MKVKVFDYYPEFDAFLCTKDFKNVNGLLGLNEWTPVVWLTRILARDQDFGEHIFDNWDEREKLEEFYEDNWDERERLEFCKEEEDLFPENEDFNSLLIVAPERFTEGDQYCWHCKETFKSLPCPKCGNDVNVAADGPCHSDKVKKLFWSDVFKSLEISFDTMVAVAREKSDYIDEGERERAKLMGKELPKLEDQIELAAKHLLKDMLDEIKIGMTRYEVKEVLGEPDDWGGTSRKYPTPSIYKYGDVELHFQGWKDGVLGLVYTEVGNGDYGITLMK